MNLERFKTVKQLASPASPFTEASLRRAIFNAKHNGLNAAIIRVGRKVLIDTEAFARWIESHRQNTDTRRPSSSPRPEWDYTSR